MPTGTIGKMSDNEGNAVGPGVAELLGKFGLVTTDKRDQVEETINGWLEAKTYRARLSSYRYGEAKLETDAREAPILRYETDNIVKACRKAGLDEVKKVTVTVTVKPLIVTTDQASETGRELGEA